MENSKKSTCQLAREEYNNSLEQSKLYYINYYNKLTDDLKKIFPDIIHVKEAKYNLCGYTFYGFYRDIIRNPFLSPEGNCHVTIFNLVDLGRFLEYQDKNDWAKFKKWFKDCWNKKTNFTGVK
jgi:hypothetical protein